MIYKFWVFSVFAYFYLSLSICSDVLAQSPESKLKVGETAINFKGTDQFGNEFELAKTLEKGPVVLLFYRGHWCPYCNKQLSQMEDSLDFITDKGGIVVAVTPEKPEYIDQTIEKTNASFLILHDKDLNIMNKYGVGFELSDIIVDKYLSRGRDLDIINGNNGANLPVPATYIISQENEILYVFYDVDYRKRATVGKILEKL